MIFFRFNISLFVFFVSISAGIANAEYTLEQRQHLKKVNEMFRAQYQHNIIVSGKVVDESGQPLDNVNIHLRRTYNGKKGKTKSFDGMSSWTNERHQVNKNFKFYFDEINTVSLSFFKEGYYGEIYDYPSPSTDQKMHIKNGIKYYDKEKIVLKKMGKLLPVKKYETSFKNNNESFEVWNLNDIDPKLKLRQRPVKILVKNIEEIECSAMYVELYSDTSPAMFTEYGIKYFPKNKGIKLVLKDGMEGGFIPIERNGMPKKELERSIVEAPKNGYKSEMEIPKIIFGSNEIVYFYFKMKNFYGKGQIYNARYFKNGEFKVRVIFIVQPDGSRNVETRNFY